MFWKCSVTGAPPETLAAIIQGTLSITDYLHNAGGLQSTLTLMKNSEAV